MDVKRPVIRESFETGEQGFNAVQCILNDFNLAMLQSILMTGRQESEDVFN
jgi:hypothetical protein